MDVASMILGILSIIFSFFCQCITVITAPVGLVLGIVDLARNPKGSKGMSIAGIVLSTLSLIVLIIILVFFSGVFSELQYYMY